MRVKIIACLALAILLVSSSAASASLVKFSFPAIMPTYGSEDTEKLMGTIGGIVEFTNEEIASNEAHASSGSSPGTSILSYPVTSIPGPETLLSALAPPAKSDTEAKNNIHTALIGTNLTYYSIAGKPMNYTITADSIKSIDRFAYKGKPVWKVRVGEGLAWDLIMDITGKEILDTEQLFRT
jgi:hypothetical protein